MIITDIPGKKKKKDHLAQSLLKNHQSGTENSRENITSAEDFVKCPTLLELDQ